MVTESPITTFRKNADPRMSMEAFGALFSPALNKATILRWERDGVPAKRVLEVERVTGISRRELRPDLFGNMGEPS